MSRDAVKLEGYLSKLPVKGLIKKWTRKWFILYATSHEGVVRIEYFDSQECARNDTGKRTIPLRDCTGLSTAVGNKIHPYVFQFNSQIGHHVLASESQPGMEDWMDAIQQAVQEDRINRRRTKTQSKVIASPDVTLDYLNESGLSFKNKVDSGIYRVTVEENETSLRMNLSGSYNLELNPIKLCLTAPTGAVIFDISYRFLRNYGKQSGQFHFQTGKNSPIGEGKLIFVTTCSKEIFGVVHNNIKRLKDQLPTKQPEQKASPLQQKKSTQPLHNPRQSIGSNTSSRPGSRHSAEVIDSSVPGTYRISRNVDESGQATIMEEKIETNDTHIYTAVDKSKKSSVKKQQQTHKKSAPPPLKPYGERSQGPDFQTEEHSYPEEAIYTEPYEEDPAYKPPPVPRHQTSVQDPRISNDLEENVFFNSFDSEENFDQNKIQLLTDGMDNLLHGNDFPTSGGTAAGGIELSNSTGFSFDFTDAGLPVGQDDPFCPNFGNEVRTSSNLAEFDLGTLDANFFDQLEAIEAKDQAGMHSWGPAAAQGKKDEKILTNEELEKFWSDMNASVPKFQ